ncbi:hypothetical protein BXY80_0790 [Ichthyenterobacterium magnum]|uniref:Uncharacterized protein n=1 Tax=Ichthyenterobacterium magnum TaxID=1230530 RepID=A0A420DWW0_9FLAO|nr:hypothetical protein BXY80_0790 [Ichthyenterobacterium magnum]
MKATENKQCPNCWGYQEYDENYPKRHLSKKSN